VNCNRTARQISVILVVFAILAAWNPAAQGQEETP
jgi:hypothetical protein